MHIPRMRSKPVEAAHSDMAVRISERDAEKSSRISQQADWRFGAGMHDEGTEKKQPSPQWQSFHSAIVGSV